MLPTDITFTGKKKKKNKSDPLFLWETYQIPLMHQISSLPFQLTEATSKAKQGWGWGHSLLPISGKPFLGEIY